MSQDLTLLAIIAGAGVASSAAVAYALSRRDDEAVIRLKREVSDARDADRKIANVVDESVRGVRDDMRKAEANEKRMDETVDAKMRAVRDGAYTAFKTADRAVALGQVGSVQRQRLLSDAAAYKSSIQADLDRLAREVRLANVDTLAIHAPKVPASVKIAMNAKQTSDDGDGGDDGGDGSDDDGGDEVEAADPGADTDWATYEFSKPEGGTPLGVEECYSTKITHSMAAENCQVLCDETEGCNGLSVRHQGCTNERHRCILYKDGPNLGGKDGREIIMRREKPITDANGTVVATQPVTPTGKQWAQYTHRKPEGGAPLNKEKCSSKTKTHGEALQDCIGFCNENPGCNGLSVRHQGCSGDRHRCILYSDGPGVGGDDGREIIRRLEDPPPPPAPVKAGEKPVVRSIFQHEKGGTCIDANGKDVYMGTCGADNQYQQWTALTGIEDGWSLLQHGASGKCLDADGSKLYFNPCTAGNQYQNWQLRPSANGKLIVHKQSGKCVDSNGNKVYFGPCDANNEYQRFYPGGK